MKRSFVRLFIMLYPLTLMTLCCQNVQAAVEGQRVELKGRLVSPLACTVNQGADSSVSFGNAVITKRIDGVNYKQKANYTIECKGNVNNLIKMQLAGSGTDFDSKAVSTTNKDVGVALYNGKSRIGVNDWISITYPGIPEINLVPVKRPDTTLKGGSFSGYVRLNLEYQ